MSLEVDFGYDDIIAGDSAETENGTQKGENIESSNQSSGPQPVSVYDRNTGYGAASGGDSSGYNARNEGESGGVSGQSEDDR